MNSAARSEEEIAKILYTHHRNCLIWISSRQLPWEKLSRGDFLKVKEQWIELAELITPERSALAEKKDKISALEIKLA